MFKGKEGQRLARDIGKRVKTFVPGAPVGERAIAAAGDAAAMPASARQNIEAIKVRPNTVDTRHVVVCRCSGH